MQVRGLEAVLSHFDPALPGHVAGANPLSPVYGGRMVDPANMFLWAWDARPFPAFPELGAVWADGANWETGHWITGRLEGVPLDRLVAALLADYGLPAATELALDGFMDGYVVDRPMSAREALEPLARAFAFDAVASGGTLRFRSRSGRAVATLTPGEIVPDRDGAGLALRRMQETELPREVRVGFTDGDRAYRRAAVASRRLAGTSRREVAADLAVVTRRAEAQRLADVWLQDLWVGRETAEFGLSPRAVALEVGDIVALPAGSAPRLFRITRIADGPVRRVSARAAEPSVYDMPASHVPRPPTSTPPVWGKPHVLALDLPLALETPTPLQHLAVFADPWPGRMAVWRSVDGATFDLHAMADTPALVGRTQTALPPGPLWRWDRNAGLTVRLQGGTLAGVDDLRALAGANTLAVCGADGRWEILTAAQADLVAEGTVRLSRLLRGLGGSETEAGRAVPAGADVVVLDGALVPLATRLVDLGLAYRYRVGPADRDHADPAYVELTAAAGPLALRPLAPVHVRARRTSAGVELSWRRRSRLGGDGWEPLDVPLGEEAERYEIDILAGATVRRTIAATAPAVVYPAADELADFGSAQTALSLTVVQMSAAVGRGFARTVTVPVR